MRLTFIYLTILLSFSLLACQGQQEETQNDKDAVAQARPQAPYNNIGVRDFSAKMQEENIVILDVRTPEETAMGKIAGAIEIDYKSEDFEDQINQLDRSKTYLVYCRSGGRSSRACQVMVDKNFDSLYNLMGGYTAFNAVKH